MKEILNASDVTVSCDMSRTVQVQILLFQFGNLFLAKFYNKHDGTYTLYRLEEIPNGLLIP